MFLGLLGEWRCFLCVERAMCGAGATVRVVVGTVPEGPQLGAWRLVVSPPRVRPRPWHGVYVSRETPGLRTWHWWSGREFYRATFRVDLDEVMPPGIGMRPPVVR
jgi:hypothetical protein